MNYQAPAYDIDHQFKLMNLFNYEEEGIPMALTIRHSSVCYYLILSPVDQLTHGLGYRLFESDSYGETLGEYRAHKDAITARLFNSMNAYMEELRQEIAILEANPLYGRF